jgi:hypothetical protein
MHACVFVPHSEVVVRVAVNDPIDPPRVQVPIVRNLGGIFDEMAQVAPVRLQEETSAGQPPREFARILRGFGSANLPLVAEVMTAVPETTSEVEGWGGLLAKESELQATTSMPHNWVHHRRYLCDTSRAGGCYKACAMHQRIAADMHDKPAETNPVRAEGASRMHLGRTSK